MATRRTHVRRRVEFGLLGPFEVRVGGRAVGVGSPKHRVLLATLLLRAGHPVSTSELADAMWDDAPPGNPRGVVQVYVARLRAMLAAAAPGPVISTCADGYLADVPPDQVDLGRFQHWLQQARRAGERADVDREAAALTEALAQWRGEPLAGVPSELLQREVAPRLREQRSQVLERRIDLDLRAGRYAELVSELVGLTGRYPLRERFWAQLMTALNAGGRRVDALDAYHTVRRHLAEELGVDPGEELRELHATILTGREGDRRRAVLPPVPRQLPPDLPGFAGRAGEVAELDALLAGQGGDTTPPVVVVISGMAGVGKTALAARWARRVTDRFPDGQLWVNLRGYDPGQSMPPEQALTGFLRALGVPGEKIPLDLDDQVGLYRSLLDGRRMLVVLDNANTPAQVRPLLPGAAGCPVVVTSRSQLTSLVAAEAAHPLQLDLLMHEEARQLLAHRIGRHRIMAELPAVTEIIGRCARLPLALAIVAARAVAYPDFDLHALAAELRDAGGGLDAFGTDDSSTDVRAVFSWSYRTLSAGAARLFRLLGLHPGPHIGIPAAASLAGVPPPRVRPLLAELTSAHLLTEHNPGRYSLHDLLRAYATELAADLETEPDRRAATHLVLDHYLHTAHAAALLVHPYRDPITLAPAQPVVTPQNLNDQEHAIGWFGVEHPVLLAAVDLAAATGFDTHTWQLAWTLTTALDRGGHWRDIVTTQHAALDAARRLADRTTQANAHRYLANAYTNLAAFSHADTHLRHALDLFRELTDQVGQAHVRCSLAFLLELQDRPTDALQHAREALHLYQITGHVPGQAFALNQVGWYHAKVGNPAPAIAHCQQALTMQQEIGDRPGEACTWDSLGYAYHQAGDYQQAIVCYQRALDLYQSLEYSGNQANTLHRYGDTHHAAGNLDAARATWEHALHILAELDHPDAEPVRTKLDTLTARVGVV